MEASGKIKKAGRKKLTPAPENLNLKFAIESFHQAIESRQSPKGFNLHSRGGKPGTDESFKQPRKGLNYEGRAARKTVPFR